MPSRLPVTLDFGTLPQTGQGYTPQQFANILGTNGAIFTEQEFALFVTGSTAPTSDVGPWLANGNEWRVWDDDTGTYVPITIDQGSLGYIISDSEPDPDIYQFWIKTAVGGSPLGLFTYYSGAWVDVYASTIGGYMTVAAFNTAIANYSTTAQMNTAISNGDAATLASANAYTDAQIAALPGGLNPRPASATNSSQSVTADGSPVTVNFDSVEFDPDGVYDAGGSRYVCPVNGIYQVNVDLQVDNSSADASGMEVSIGISGTNLNSGSSVGDPPGQRWYPQVSGLVQMSAGSGIQVSFYAADGTGTGSVTLSNGSFSVFLVKAT